MRTADGRGWMITCRNPQLRVRGPYKGDFDKDCYEVKVFGLETEVVNPLVQVVRWRVCSFSATGIAVLMACFREE